MRRRFLAVLAGFSVLVAGGAAAQEYPTRPIRLIVGYGAGGATDLAARIVADHLEKTLGQPVTVENRPGGNGIVGTRAVFMAAPDGYTLGMTSGSILTVLPWTMDVGFDPLKLTFLGFTHESFYALFVKGACKKIDFPVAPMAFTLILGPLTEKALRQALSMSGGDVAILTRGPLATALLAVAAVTLLAPLGVHLWERVRSPAA